MMQKLKGYVTDFRDRINESGITVNSFMYAPHMLAYTRIVCLLGFVFYSITSPFFATLCFGTQMLIRIGEGLEPHIRHKTMKMVMGAKAGTDCILRLVVDRCAYIALGTSLSTLSPVHYSWLTAFMLVDFANEWIKQHSAGFSGRQNVELPWLLTLYRKKSLYPLFLSFNTEMFLLLSYWVAQLSFTHGIFATALYYPLSIARLVLLPGLFLNMAITCSELWVSWSFLVQLHAVPTREGEEGITTAPILSAPSRALDAVVERIKESNIAKAAMVLKDKGIKLSEQATDLTSTLTETFTEVKDQALGKGKEAIDEIKEQVDDVVEASTAPIKKATKKVQKQAADIKEDLADTAEETVAPIKKKALSIKKKALAAKEDAEDLKDDISEQVSDVVEEVKAPIKKKAKVMKKKAKALKKDISSEVSDKVSDVAESVEEKAAPMKKKAASIKKAATKKATGAKKALKAKAADVSGSLDDATDFVKHAPRKLKSKAADIKNAALEAASATGEQSASSSGSSSSNNESASPSSVSESGSSASSSSSSSSSGNEEMEEVVEKPRKYIAATGKRVIDSFAGSSSSSGSSVSESGSSVSESGSAVSNSSSSGSSASESGSGSPSETIEKVAPKLKKNVVGKGKKLIKKAQKAAPAVSESGSGSSGSSVSESGSGASSGPSESGSGSSSPSESEGSVSEEKEEPAPKKMLKKKAVKGKKMVKKLAAKPKVMKLKDHAEVPFESDAVEFIPKESTEASETFESDFVEFRPKTERAFTEPVDPMASIPVDSDYINYTPAPLHETRRRRRAARKMDSIAEEEGEFYPEDGMSTLFAPETIELAPTVKDGQRLAYAAEGDSETLVLPADGIEETEEAETISPVALPKATPEEQIAAGGGTDNDGLVKLPSTEWQTVGGADYRELSDDGETGSPLLDDSQRAELTNGTYGTKAEVEVGYNPEQQTEVVIAPETNKLAEETALKNNRFAALLDDEAMKMEVS